MTWFAVAAINSKIEDIKVMSQGGQGHLLTAHNTVLITMQLRLKIKRKKDRNKNFIARCLPTATLSLLPIIFFIT